MNFKLSLFNTPKNFIRLLFCIYKKNQCLYKNPEEICYRECIIFLDTCRNIKQEEKKNEVSNISKHKYYKEFGTYLNFYINYFGIVFTKE